MSKTGGSHLAAILDEWAYDIETTPPSRIIRAWVGHFHTHYSVDEPPHECLGAVIAGSEFEDIPAALSAYRLSTEVTCSALVVQTTEREFVVSHTASRKQWRVVWSLDDYGRVDFKEVRPTIHLSSRRLMKLVTSNQRRRGQMSLVGAIELVQEILDNRRQQQREQN